MFKIARDLPAIFAILLICGGLGATDQPGKTSWFKGSLDQALALAKKEKKPVFVYFSAHWCLPCVALKSQLFPNPDFEALMLNQYIPYYMDYDAPGSQGWMEKFSIQFIPQIVVLSSEGNELMRPTTIAGHLPIIDALRGSANLKRSLESIATDAAQDKPLALSDEEWKLMIERITTGTSPLLKNNDDTIKAYKSLFRGLPAEKKDMRRKLLIAFLNAQESKYASAARESEEFRKDFDVLFDDLANVESPDIGLELIELMVVKPEERKKYQERLVAALEKWRDTHAQDKSVRGILQRIESFNPLLSLAEANKKPLTPVQLNSLLRNVGYELKLLESLTPSERDVVAIAIGYLLLNAKQFAKASEVAQNEIDRGSSHKEKFKVLQAHIAEAKGDKLKSKALRFEALASVSGRSSKLMSAARLITDGPTLDMQPPELTELLERTFSDFFSSDDSVEGWDTGPFQQLLGFFLESKDKLKIDWPLLRSRLEKEFCRGQPNCISIARALGDSSTLPKMLVKQVVNMSLAFYDKTRLGIYFENKEGWHTYAKKADQTALPMAISTHTGSTVINSDAIESWPATTQFTGIDREEATGYGGRYGFFISITDALRDAMLSTEGLRVEAKWLACKDICIPGKSTMIARLGQDGVLTTEPPSFVVTNAEATKWLSEATPAADLPGTSDSGGLLGLLAILGLALLGGFILNFMPCVLPVISIKLFSLVKQRGESRNLIARHSLAYTAGVLVSFLALALGVIVLKMVGTSVGWGFQLQSPIFVAAMILVVFVMMLSFFGLFEFRALGMNFMVGKLDSAERSKKISGTAGSFGNGLLATLLATPCSAPFLGTALAFAFLASPPMIVLVFIFVGIGLSTPFLLIAAFPSMLRLLPKPGAWMEKFRRILGMLLAVTLIWLIDVYTSLSVGPDRAFWLSLTLLFTFFLLYGWQHLAHGIIGRILLVGLFVASVVPLVKSFNETEQQALLNWQKWSPEAQAQAVAEGKKVFVDFTAEWCITCKYNEKLFLETTSFAELVKREGVVVMKADFTRSDKTIADYLQAHGKPGVPAYFVQTPEKGLIDLGSLLTPGILSDALSTQESK